jgi:hypothetical protein
MERVAKRFKRRVGKLRARFTRSKVVCPFSRDE